LFLFAPSFIFVTIKGEKRDSSVFLVRCARMRLLLAKNVLFMEVFLWIMLYFCVLLLFIVLLAP
jgi:hypothetical protein